MGAIGLAGLALLAESQLAVALDGVRRGRRRILRREEAVAHIVRRGAGGSKDGRGVAPVEQEVEGDADGRGAVASPATLPTGATDIDNNPHSPCCQSIDKHEGKVCRKRAARPLHLARPSTSRRRHGRRFLVSLAGLNCEKGIVYLSRILRS